MTRGELGEIMVIASDLSVAMDIKEQIDAGTERGLISFADGEKLKVPIPEEIKQQLNNKIARLTEMLKRKIKEEA